MGAFAASTPPYLKCAEVWGFGFPILGANWTRYFAVMISGSILTILIVVVGFVDRDAVNEFFRLCNITTHVVNLHWYVN